MVALVAGSDQFGGPVVRRRSWFVVDESGTALRAEGDSDLLWKLLGISGGYPVTVCGTWNALALTPISVSREAGDRAVSTLISVALLGTARTATTFEELPAEVRGYARELDGDPAEMLLAGAALERAYRRGGAGSTTAAVPTPAPDDVRFTLPESSSAHLLSMLAAKRPCSKNGSQSRWSTITVRLIIWSPSCFPLHVQVKLTGRASCRLSASVVDGLPRKTPSGANSSEPGMPTRTCGVTEVRRSAHSG